MRSIPFTQYLRPDGRKVDMQIEMPDDVCDKAERIIELGHRFEAEVLSTGHVSLTITGVDDNPDWDGEEHDLAHQLCSNGPKVPEAIKLMVERFYFEKGLGNG